MLTGLKFFFGKKTRHKKRTKNLPRTIETDCHGKVEILSDDWYNISNFHRVYGWDFPSGFCIGIVKMRDKFGKVKTYIGIGKGKDYLSDICLVLDCGIPFYHKGE